MPLGHGAIWWVEARINAPPARPASLPRCTSTHVSHLQSLQIICLHATHIYSQLQLPVHSMPLAFPVAN